MNVNTSPATSSSPSRSRVRYRECTEECDRARELPCLGRRVLYKENVPKTIGFDPDWDARISGDLEIFR